MNRSANDLKLLTEIGFSAILRRADTDVVPIFDALRLSCPDNAAGAIGLSLLALTRGDPQTAIGLLEAEGVTKKQSRDEAKAVLVLARKLVGQVDQARELAGDLTSHAGPAQRFAALVVSEDGTPRTQDEAPAPRAAAG